MRSYSHAEGFEICCRAAQTIHLIIPNSKTCIFRNRFATGHTWKQARGNIPPTDLMEFSFLYDHRNQLRIRLRQHSTENWTTVVNAPVSNPPHKLSNYYFIPKLIPLLNQKEKEQVALVSRNSVELWIGWTDVPGYRVWRSDGWVCKVWLGFCNARGKLWTFLVIWKAAVRDSKGVCAREMWVLLLINSTEYKQRSPWTYNACMLAGVEVRGHFELDLLWYCILFSPLLIGSVSCSFWMAISLDWDEFQVGPNAEWHHRTARTYCKPDTELIWQ